MADGFVQLARQRPRKHRRHVGERLEVAVGKKWARFDHETIVAAPSDTQRLRGARLQRTMLAAQTPS
jgi:hypothetical protein